MTAATAGRRTADPQRWWVLDSLREGGHTPAETLAFMSYLADEGDAAKAERDLGLRTTAGLDLGPRRGRGLLARLLGRYA